MSGMFLCAFKKGMIGEQVSGMKTKGEVVNLIKRVRINIIQPDLSFNACLNKRGDMQIQFCSNTDLTTPNSLVWTFKKPGRLIGYTALGIFPMT